MRLRKHMKVEKINMKKILKLLEKPVPRMVTINGILIDNKYYYFDSYFKYIGNKVFINSDNNVFDKENHFIDKLKLMN